MGPSTCHGAATAPEPPPQSLQRVDQAPTVHYGAGKPAFTQRVERWRSVSMHATRVVHMVTGVSVDQDLLLAPSTFMDLQVRYRDVLGKGRLEEPSTNLLAGALYLADCARILNADLGDPAGLNLVLDAYNLGPRAAVEWGATGSWFDRSEVEHSLPAETIQHAERIIAAYQRARQSP